MEPALAVGEMKIKLPRKRKKACIKEVGRANYQLLRMANEVIYEEKPIKETTQFIKKTISPKGRKLKFSYW